MMSNSWKSVQLGDVCEIKHGFAFKGENFIETETDNILLTPGNFSIGGGFKADKFKYYQGEVPADYILSPNDLIVTMTDLSKAGDTLGFAALVPFDNNHKYLHNQRIGKVILKSNEIFLDYLHWLMRTSSYQQYIVGRASGSTVKHTSPKSICSYVGLFPPYNTQVEISSLLTAIENKLICNRVINHHLAAG